MFSKLLLLIATKLAVVRSFVPDLFIFFDNVAYLISIPFRGILHFIRYEDFETFYNILFIVVIISIGVWYIYFKDKE